MANDEKKQKKNKRFFKDFKAELKKVIWPTPKQLVNNTVAVITIVLILTTIVFFLDIAFEALNTYGIDKIRSAVSTSAEEQTTVVDDTATNSETEENNTEESTDDEKTEEAEDAKNENSSVEETE